MRPVEYTPELKYYESSWEGLMPEATHDPHQFLNQLRQTLATSKLAIGFLLGAGCPCAMKNSEGEPLIPDVVGLTRKVREQVSKSEKHKTSFEALLNVLAEDGEATPNIETILGRIRALNDVAGKGKARGLSSDELAELDRTICGAITDIVDCEASADKTPYRSLAKFIQDRRGLPTEVFTTNYDLLLENALEDERMPYFDGFVGGVRPFFDQTAIDDDKIPERWCRFWKLHGSINWRSNKKRIIRSKDKNDGDEQLIHPSHRKYDESRRMPYLVMMDRLRGFIRNQHHRERLPAALIVVGYSFSDKHINEALAENLRANPSAVCYALQYEALGRYPQARELATEVANLSILAKDSAVIRRQTGAWVARATVDPTSIMLGFSFDKEAAGDDEPRPCSFHLGDFGRFGNFLDTFVVATE
jgi:hypothetical protein